MSKVRITLHSAYGEEAVYDLIGFIRWLNELLDTVPPEYRDAAKVEFERADYDGFDSWKIYYDRPETAEEVSAREAASARWREEQMQRERMQYEALKKKFEP